MGKRTPLFDAHKAAGAKMVDFAGWDMPVNYGSQIDEHLAVRARAGMFDVSHMAAVDVRGTGARAYLRYLWANDVARADTPGKALYTCMLNEQGGVVDDLIVYHVADGHYRTVVNAGTADKDLAWMQAHAEGFDVTVERRPDLGIVAVQGPQARELALGCLPADLREPAAQLKPFFAAFADDRLVGRTGYTGEDGFECILPAADLLPFWDALAAAGVEPCGLGARDTLRLEAGLNLYGQDMDEDTHPLESGLGWTVAWEPADRDFVGRAALTDAASDPQRKLVGVLLTDRGVLRHGQTVRHAGAGGEGLLTSGTYSPTLKCSIGLARVPQDWAEGDSIEVERRGRWCGARIVKYPFVRNGEARIQI